MKALLIDIVGVIGFAAILTGLIQFYPPLAYVVGGTVAVLLAVLWSWKK